MYVGDDDVDDDDGPWLDSKDGDSVAREPRTIFKGLLRSWHEPPMVPDCSMVL